MAVRVPDTNTFSLQDVYNAVSDHASPSANLSSCFTNATSGYFDPVYEGSKNRLSNFRNYGPMVPEFIVITADRRVALLDIDGNFKFASPTYYTREHQLSDYDRTNKVLMYITQGRYLGVVDGNDLLNLRSKQITNYLLTNISKTNDYWFRSIYESRNGKYSSLEPYENFSMLNDIFSSTPQTSGSLRKFISTDSIHYYYSTDAGEIGHLFPVGGSGNELHDSDTHAFSEMTYQGNVFLAFANTRRCRYMINNNWYNFELNSTDPDPGPAILRALPYTTSYSIALAGRSIYRVSHTDPPVSTNITPYGYYIYGISVAGSYAYAVGTYSGINRILRANLGSSYWSVYMNNIPNTIYEVWKY